MVRKAVRRPPGGGRKPPPPPPVGVPQGTRDVGGPVFGQPQPTPDPTIFRVQHPSDGPIYKQIDALNAQHLIHPLPFPAPRGGVEPRLTLDQVLNRADASKKISTSGKIVFHATGDCGSTRGPTHQNQVTDKMVSDFNELQTEEIPQFNLLLGDIVYSFGEAQYYYDQFYEPYRDYDAPILAVPGNHDGMVPPYTNAKTLDAFLRNFCSETFVVTPEAGGLSRTAQIQPGVFYTFEAPFLRILAIYSNMLEDPGVIADKQYIGSSQIDFLKAALERVKAEKYKGALIFAHHHPPYSASNNSSRHGGSAQMLADMDRVCEATGVWPHAVLAGHVHNYQRFTRTRGDGTEIPYVSCGNGGHNVMSLTRKGNTPMRTPQTLQNAQGKLDQVVFENYDDLNYGYLRCAATASQLRIEYHAASDGPNVKAPDDAVTVDLATRKISHFVAPNLGHPAQAKEVRRQHALQAKSRGH